MTPFPDPAARPLHCDNSIDEPPPTLIASTPEDVLAFIPVAFGFVPSQSVVLLAIHAGSGDRFQPFQARLDLPDDPAHDLQLAQTLIDPCLRHGVDKVLIVVYAERRRAQQVADTVAASVGQFGIDLIDSFGTHQNSCFPLGPGAERLPARPFDLQSHPFSAQAVLHGLVTVASRAELASTLDTDREAADQVQRVLSSALPIPARWVPATLVADAQAARDGALSATQAGAWLRTVGRRRPRQELLASLSRANARDQLFLWTRILQVSPHEHRAEAAAIVALVSWLSGNGALAWCAVDECLARQPQHLLAQCVAQALTEAWPPSTWDRALQAMVAHPEPAIATRDVSGAGTAGPDRPDCA